MALGVNPIDTGLMQQGMAMQSNLLQNLGKQLRQDVQVIQTQRQLQGLAQNIQSIDPNSADFAPKLVGLMSQYPMAAQSPIGQAAINTLGAQHRAYQAELAAQRSADRSFDRQIGLMGAREFLDKRTYTGTPATTQDIRNAANGTGSIVEPPLPGNAPSIAPAGAPAAAGDAMDTSPVYPASDVLPTGIPGIPQPAASPLDTLGSIPAKVAAFEKDLISKKLPQQLAESLLKGYQNDLLMAGRVKTSAPRLFPTADGGLIAATPQGAVAVPLPAGTRLPTKSTADMDEQGLADHRKFLQGKYAVARTIAERENKLYASLDPTQFDPANPQEKKDYEALGMRAKGAEEEMVSLKKQIDEVNAKLKKPDDLPKKGSGKPIPDDVRQDAIQSIEKTKNKAAVIQRLLELGYDTTGM